MVISVLPGDLAKKMIPPSLYRLERMRDARMPVITGGIRQLDARTVDQPCQNRLVSQGQDRRTVLIHSIGRAPVMFMAASTSPKLYEKLHEGAEGQPRGNVLPRGAAQSLFVIVAQHLYNADLLHGDAFTSWRSRFGTSYDTAVDLNRTLHSIMRKNQIFPTRPLPGQGTSSGRAVPALRQHDVRADLGTNHCIDCIMITMSENFRRRRPRFSFYDPVGNIP